MPGSLLFGREWCAALALTSEEMVKDQLQPQQSGQRQQFKVSCFKCNVNKCKQIYIPMCFKVIQGQFPLSVCLRTV